MDNFKFSIIDIASLLDLTVRHKGSYSIDTDCPFCGKKDKMNLNLSKNIFRCNYCGKDGGMLALYAMARNIHNSAAYREISDALSGGQVRQYSDVSPIPSDLSVQETEMASLDERDKTYRMLFSLLTLSKTHKDNLLARGLSEDDIYKYGCKSTPAFGFTKLTDTLESLGCTMNGIPGFYRKSGRWLTSFCSNCSGIVIPVISLEGKVQGAQIRLDRPINDRKYIWFSSTDRENGVGAGSPTHFIGDPNAKVVYITEGPLKADVAHSLSGKTFAAVAGVNQYKSLDALLGRLKCGGTETIVEAYDMDKITNENVEKGCRRLIELCNGYGFEVKRISWDPIYKGIDDYLLAKKKGK